MLPRLTNAVKKRYSLHVMKYNALTNVNELNLILKSYFNHALGAERVSL